MAQCVGWQEERWGISYDEFKKGIDRAREDRMWFFGMLEKLRKEYANKWVAVHGKKIIAVAEDRDELVEEIKRKGVDISTVEMQFVTPERLLWVL